MHGRTFTKRRLGFCELCQSIAAALWRASVHGLHPWVRMRSMKTMIRLQGKC